MHGVVAPFRFLEIASERTQGGRRCREGVPSATGRRLRGVRGARRSRRGQGRGKGKRNKAADHKPKQAGTGARSELECVVGNKHFTDSILARYTISLGKDVAVHSTASGEC